MHEVEEEATVQDIAYFYALKSIEAKEDKAAEKRRAARAKAR